MKSATGGEGNGFARLVPDSQKTKHVPARRDLLREGDQPQLIFRIREGWAARYKSSVAGRRQILSFLLPGDFCNPQSLILRRMDFSVGAISAVEVEGFALADVGRLIADDPAAAAAFRQGEAVTASIEREWLLNVGQRGGLQRIAHLICELFHLARRKGLVEGHILDHPLTQADIADATSLTPVHVNRMFGRLRAAGWIEIKGRQLRLVEPEVLAEMAGFRTNYLHDSAAVHPASGNLGFLVGAGIKA